MRLSPLELRRLRRILSRRRPADAPPNLDALARWQLEHLAPNTARWADRFDPNQQGPEAGPGRRH